MYVPTVIIIALASLTIAAPGTLLDTAAPIMGRMESHEIRDAARGTGSKSGNTQGGGGKTQGGGSQMQGGGGQTQSGTGKTQGGGKPFTGIATFNRYADQTNTVCGPMKGSKNTFGAAAGDLSPDLSAGLCDGKAGDMSLCSNGQSKKPYSGPACPHVKCNKCYRVTSNGPWSGSASGSQGSAGGQTGGKGSTGGQGEKTAAGGQGGKNPIGGQGSNTGAQKKLGGQRRAMPAGGKGGKGGGTKGGMPGGKQEGQGGSQKGAGGATKGGQGTGANSVVIQIIDGCPSTSADNYCKVQYKPEERCGATINALDIEQGAYKKLTGKDYVKGSSANLAVSIEPLDQCP